MVGVPGRSKACLTCRRRKKGCDLQQPACGQCRRAAIECGGYERQRIFIHTTQAEAHGKPLRLETEMGPHQSLIQVEASPHQAMVILPESLTQSAYGDKFLELYWGSYLPNGRSFSAEAAKYSTAGWTNAVQDLHRQDKPVHMALMANCMGLVGRRDGQRWMVEESLRVYGQALKAVVGSLRVPVKMASIELLVASRLLSLFELCFGTDEVEHPAQSQRWSAHIAGGMAIMASRKPFAYIRGHAHRVFVDSRLHQIINDIQLRRPSFLSEPVWKTIPWLEVPKDPKDVLLDILVDIPGTLGEFDSMQSCINLQERERRRGELYSRCLEYDKELQAWASNIGRPAMDFIVKKLAEGDLEDQTPTSEELSMAHLGIIHCITCILLYHVLHSTTKASTTPERMNPRAYCRKMARLLPLFLARNAGGFVISMVTFPVGMALSYLRVGDASRHLVSEEQQMLLRVFEGEYGAEIRRFLVSRQRDRQEIV